MADSEGIHSVFISLRGSLARAVLGIVPPREIEDIVQETYVRVCQLEEKTALRSPGHFSLKSPGIWHWTTSSALSHASL
jgi:RNA polymerase sigma-70 factor (ECF subfamily)